MEDRLLVEALRSRDPIAMGAVYDDYAERLYRYCWFQLRNGDAAQVALRDTLMCAEAHAGRLRAPARFGAWLYAFARIECRRRRPAGPVQPDLPVARHDQDDVDLRLMAWRAVTGLPPLSRELLDLRHRHGLTDPDIALVVGLRARDVADRLGQAGVLLEAALIAEILAHDGLDGCASRAALLRPRRDEIDADLRESLVRHSLECARCARHLPDNIAPGKVYDLLPKAPLPEPLRAHIMNCFTDPDLAGYRLFAAARVSRFGAHGFPAQPGSGRSAAFLRGSDDSPYRAARAWSRAVTAIAGAVIASVTATALCGYYGQESSRGSHGIVAAPPGGRSPRPSPTPPGRSGTSPVSAALPLRPRETGPAVALGDSPPKDFLWAPGADDLSVSPGRLTLPPGGVGTITLSSANDPIQWRLSGAGPLRVSPDEGALQPHVAQIITVRAPGTGPGSAALTFWPGGKQVEIAWSGHSSTPPSSPPPSSPPTSPPPTSPPSSPPTTPPTTPTPTPTPTPTATVPRPTPPPAKPTPAPSAPPTPPPNSPGEQRPTASSSGSGT
jgi:DNA-directed RNA polymerase specialized sigma24 family protein